jgi:hypothetical protein
VRSYRHGYGTAQLLERTGVGYRAWRRPHELLGDRALNLLGARRDGFPAAEWRRMRRLARAAYVARMAGSLHAGARRRRR